MSNANLDLWQICIKILDRFESGKILYYNY